MKVLLVDDEEQLVSALAERLVMRGIEASWVSNCLDAQAQAEIGKFDIAILDVKMPKMSGFELKRLLEKKSPGMKFIFVTGHGSADDFVTAAMEGSKEFYLTKPVKIETLISKMQEVMKVNQRGKS
jgi:DNA-binding response OmpR family regulator